MTLSQIYRAVLIAIAGFSVTAMLHKRAVAQAKDPQVRNVVIVHGAWADGSSWAKVIPLLQAKGLHVVAVQNPLTSLADDVARHEAGHRIAGWSCIASWPLVWWSGNHGGRERSKGNRVGLCGCARTVGWRVLCVGHETVSASSAIQRSPARCRRFFDGDPKGNRRRLRPGSAR